VPRAPATSARVLLSVGDLPRAVEFYTGRLGFRLREDGSPARAVVELAGLTIELRGSGVASGPPGPGRTAILVEVPDLDVAVGALGGGGSVPVEVAPSGDDRSVRLLDPDGVPILLTQRAPAPQPIEEEAPGAWEDEGGR
jgi:catechol 2,3-dioxygenase-like lactoylglutathione lyase family enzyme